jgi:hypothetical protein
MQDGYVQIVRTIINTQPGCTRCAILSRAFACDGRLENPGTQATRADLATGRSAGIGLRPFGRCGWWIEPGLHDGAIHRGWDELVDRGGLLQQSKLPIGDLGELSDSIRQGR